MYTILLKDNIIYWLSAFSVAALSMLPSPSFSLHFLLVVSQGQDLSLRRRSWPCCIFFERTECLKKRRGIESENLRLGIDFYMCCWVSLSDHRVPWGVSAWGIPLVPHMQRQIREVSCLAWYRPEYSFIQTYMHIYISSKTFDIRSQLWKWCSYEPFACVKCWLDPWYT